MEVDSKKITLIIIDVTYDSLCYLVYVEEGGEFVPHIHEKIDFTVSIFISQSRKVLFIFHKQLQRWLRIGGHIELEEHPEQAAIREAKEESGLNVELVGERPAIQKESGFFTFVRA
jgi:8-oxo-dGTP pyrophosphatase MutT (NUDIX family)